MPQFPCQVCNDLTITTLSPSPQSHYWFSIFIFLQQLASHRDHCSVRIDFVLHNPWAKARKWSKFISPLYKPFSPWDWQLINLSKRPRVEWEDIDWTRRLKNCFRWWLCHLLGVISHTEAPISSSIFKIGIIGSTWNILKSFFGNQRYMKIFRKYKVPHKY